MNRLVTTLLAVALAATPAFGRGRTSTASVRVDATHTIRTVDPRTFSINAAVWDGTLASGAAADVLRPLDLDLVRFPGGSLSDE